MPDDQSPDDASKTDKAKPKFCGIVRPIADMGNYTAKHWREVHSVIAEAVEPLGYTLRLVSESDTSGVILTEIVTNLYEDEMVIVDVSGRNPNVMFELGMRLAFEKPAIIVVDDDTPFSFDISPVKHIRYPRTLRYGDIVKFKGDVAAAVTATINAGPEKKNYLQQFGPIKVTELGSQSIEMSAVAQDVQEMKRMIASLLNKPDTGSLEDWANRKGFLTKTLKLPKGLSSSTIEVAVSDAHRQELFDNLSLHYGVSKIESTKVGLRISLLSANDELTAEARNSVLAIVRNYESLSN